MVHHLVRVHEAEGETAAGGLLARLGAGAEPARELAYRLYPHLRAEEVGAGGASLQCVDPELAGDRAAGAGAGGAAAGVVRHRRPAGGGRMTNTKREHATDIDAIVATMVERIADRFDPERIILFGSRARGDAGERSDVDLLVVMPDGTDRRAAAVEMRRSLRRLPAAKDIVVTTPDHIARRGHVIGTVLRPALREGKVLYERA